MMMINNIDKYTRTSDRKTLSKFVKGRECLWKGGEKQDARVAPIFEAGYPHCRKSMELDES